MNAAHQPVAPLQTLRNATVQQSPKSATGNATGCATGSLKALAIEVLRAQSAQRGVQQACNMGTANGATGWGDLLQPMQRPSGFPWPEPEAFPLVVRSVPWKYACLFAIASVYGAALTREAGGGLTLTCPATMPQEATQVARDGLAELAGYIEGRLQ